MLSIICLSVKQNLGYAWSCGSPTLGKLILNLLLKAKQNLGQIWVHGSPTLGKLAPDLLVMDNRDS